MSKKNQQEAPNQILAYYHKQNMLEIKRALGKNCTFISHISYPKYKLEEVLDEKGEVRKGMTKRVSNGTQHGIVAKFGKSEPLVATLNGKPDEIKSEYYAQLKLDLVNAARERDLL